MNKPDEGGTPPGPKPAFPGAKPPVQKLAFGKREVPPQLQNLIKKLQKNYSFFGDMIEDEVGEFLRLCKRENLEDGKKVFSEGDIGNTFYLIVSGEVRILVGEKEVARMGPGQIFGEMAMLEDAPRTATVVTSGQALLFSISRSVLATKMPAMGFKVVVGIARQLSDKLREANQLIKKLEGKPG